MKIKILYLLFCTTLIVIACSKQQENTNTLNQTPSTCSSIDSKFSTAVLPLIQSSCGGCHGTSSTSGPGALTNFTQIKASAAAIKSSIVSGRMPRGGSLTQLQIQTISCWVDGGALNN
jgi:hypothetical protein